MSKSFDRGAAKKAGAKRALPKGGGKGASGYKLYTPVKQSTIDNIKKMGMSAALKKAGSSKNAEFVQGVKRMYGADRLKTAMKTANKPVAMLRTQKEINLLLNQQTKHVLLQQRKKLLLDKDQTRLLRLHGTLQSVLSR